MAQYFINYLWLLFIALLLSGPAGATDIDVWQSFDSVAVSEIELSADAISGNWKMVAGIRVDNLNELNGLSDSERQKVADLAKQLMPLGIKSMGDFSLSSIDLPLNIVTVRLFVFNEAAQNQAWWGKKYQYLGWQQHYQSVEQAGLLRVDSLQLNKTAVAFGNIWLTTHQLQDGQEHIDAAKYIIDLLTDGKKDL